MIPLSDADHFVVHAAYAVLFTATRQAQQGFSMMWVTPDRPSIEHLKRDSTMIAILLDSRAVANAATAARMMGNTYGRANAGGDGAGIGNTNGSGNRGGTGAGIGNTNGRGNIGRGLGNTNAQRPCDNYPLAITRSQNNARIKASRMRMMSKKSNPSFSGCRVCMGPISHSCRKMYVQCGKRCMHQ